jgi:hypothetical protein
MCCWRVEGSRALFERRSFITYVKSGPISIGSKLSARCACWWCGEITPARPTREPRR